MSTNPNDPAFINYDPRMGATGTSQGLTKREEFAKAAMQGMIMARFTDPHLIAEWALGQADAMIDALNGTKEEPVPVPVAVPPTRAPAMGDDIPF